MSRYLLVRSASPSDSWILVYNFFLVPRTKLKIYDNAVITNPEYVKY